MKIWIFRFSVVAVVAMVTIAVGGRLAAPPMPDFRGAVGWLNSPPLDVRALRGKVVLVNFWTYSCINSLRELPYLKSWAAKYKDAGLVVIGVHAPEFEFEQDRRNVEAAVRSLNVTFPVAIDSNHAVWQAFNNAYWPADYLIDATGRVRYHHFGEGDYGESERALQDLLRENGAADVDRKALFTSGEGIEAPPSAEIQSPETYVGSRRAERLVSRRSEKIYSVPSRLSMNQWGLVGRWNVGPESAVVEASSAKIVFRFHSRDLHMVLGRTSKGSPVRFRVKLDGNTPGTHHGADALPDGSGEISEPRLYQLVRQNGPIADHTFEIEFLDPGAQVFSFTFG